VNTVTVSFIIWDNDRNVSTKKNRSSSVENVTTHKCWRPLQTSLILYLFSAVEKSQMLDSLVRVDGSGLFSVGREPVASEPDVALLMTASDSLDIFFS